MNFYQNSCDEVIKELKTAKDGLSVQEANKRLSENGKNKLQEKEGDPLWKKFLAQLNDPMIIILIVAAVISAFTSAYEAKIEGTSFFPTDTLIIMIVVLINAVLGVLQESKAEKAIDALQKMSQATCKVLRGGKITHISTEDVVVGDVMVLEAGDAIPADGRLIESATLTVEESSLTGESIPVKKIIDTLNLTETKVALGDRSNMVYTGSSIVYGRGKAIVTAIGMDTEIGKIADAIANASETKTPLQIKLAELSKILTKLVLGICVFIFAFSLFMHREILASGDTVAIFSEVINVFMVAVSLAVAAIPEGLAAVVTIVLSIGVTKMSEKNAIIRKLTAVETLGCAQIICSDKTGTLTQNKMTVVEHFGDEKWLAEGMSLCNDASVNDDNEVIGEPTEAALVAYGLKLGLNQNELLEKLPRVSEVPFDSSRKMMSTIHKTDKGFLQFTKGAPDVLLERCDRILADGKVVKLDAKMKEEVKKANKEMAHKALRVLALAYVEHDDMPKEVSSIAIEKDMIFVGLTGMIDPVRPEVISAIKEAKKAGTIPVMITGDHLDTAVAIAKQIGICDDESEAITGLELDALSEEEFDQRVSHLRVYARVQPEHKTRIVKAWQKQGKVVSMSGDGVNDAPSIKNADIGVGMGITGTDVTKNVADMVLADDNFATIVSAIEEGRRIYDNIRKAIQFLLGSNLAEVLSIFIATLLSFTILRAPHLLFINLVTDCFPALALGVEKAEKDIMDRSPRSKQDGIFAGGLGIDALYQGALVTILTLAAFFIGERLESGYWAFMHIADCEEGITMAFLTMSMCEIFHSFNMRSQRGSVIKMSLEGNHNKMLTLSMIASLILTTCVIEIPFLANAFGFTPIGIEEYAISLALAVSIIPLVELVKYFQRKKSV